MSKKQTKTKEEPIVPTEESEGTETVAEEKQLDRPYWVDQTYWEGLTLEEREKLIQQNQ